MNNKGNLGLVTGILLIGFILIGAVSASVIMKNTTNVSDTDLNHITNEVVDELTSYLQIKDIVGKYQTIQGEQKIQKIAILIQPLVSGTVDLTDLIIKISNGEQLHLLNYDGNSNPLGAYSLFDHPLWNTIKEDSFTLVPVIDDDASMTTNHVMNKNTDTVFIIIKLPEDSMMNKDSTLQITLLPSPGMERTVTIEAPLPTSHVVTLYE